MTDKKKPDRWREGPVNYEIYAGLPDDDIRYEVADGVLQAMSPGPGLIHQAYSNELQHRLNQHCRNEYIICSAPLDVVLSDTEIRQPDLVMIHRSRISILRKQGVFGPPDLVVEILSASSRKRDKLEKTKVYAKYRVPEYWIVDPDSVSLEQYVLRSDVYALHDIFVGDEPVRSETIPCAAFSMKELADALPDLPDD